MTEKNFCTPDGSCARPVESSYSDLYLHQSLSKQSSEAGKANKLVFEKSPYLLQHAYNPVEWYPWGEEAFAKARNEDKPIFLSIGYSSCHYCHLMEEESFDDDRVAEALNRDFVAVKVDKEERPDVDAVYMAVCQLFTGQGGWPLSIFMTSEGKPFFAGTYFPRESRSQMAGLVELLATISTMWKEERDKLTDSADMIIEQLAQKQEEEGSSKREVSGRELIVSAKRIFEEIFDERWGGFGRQPKFPSPHNMLFLLRFYQETRNDRALFMVEKTLEQMYRGGIFDHVGYGFSRYSTDEKWLAPHFEKMLYDNALMVMALTECYLLTGKDFYRQAAKQTLDYVRREMQAPGGGFFSSQDADSSGVEGKYYTFTKKELDELLGQEDSELFCRKYGITEEGNFEGGNIPNLIHAKDGSAADREKLERLRKKVYEYRLGREHLNKDHKILTSSNCLMIAAICRAAAAFGDRTLEHLAEETAAFVQENLAERDGRLYVRLCDGETGNLGYLDDYAYFAWALYELYELTHRVKYLQAAMDCQKLMCEYFWDEEKGGFFLTGNNQERLIFRPKETYDGAVPSGNSAAAYVMVKLSEKMPGGQLELMKNRQLQYVKRQAASYPAGFCFSLLAVMEAGEFVEKNQEEDEN